MTKNYVIKVSKDTHEELKQLRRRKQVYLSYREDVFFEHIILDLLKFKIKLEYFEG